MTRSSTVINRASALGGTERGTEGGTEGGTEVAGPDEPTSPPSQPAPSPVPPQVPDPVPNPPGTEVPRPDVPPEPRARRLKLCAVGAVVALGSALIGAGCGDDVPSGTPNNVGEGNEDTEVTNPTPQPGPTGDVDQPGADPESPGAVAGQDVDEIDPPGGTYGVPDPGGSGAGGREEPPPGSPG